jgi:hypothetical protein
MSLDELETAVANLPAEDLTAFARRNPHPPL